MYVVPGLDEPPGGRGPVRVGAFHPDAQAGIGIADHGGQPLVAGRIGHERLRGQRPAILVDQSERMRVGMSVHPRVDPGMLHPCPPSMCLPFPRLPAQTGRRRGHATMVLARVRRSGHAPMRSCLHGLRAGGPGRDKPKQGQDLEGSAGQLWVTAPAATFPLSPVHQTGITIINVNSVCAVLPRGS